MELSSIVATVIGILLTGGMLYALYRLRRNGDFRLGTRAFVLIISGLMAITSYWLAVNATPARVGWIFFGANILTFGYTIAEPAVVQAILRNNRIQYGIITARDVFIEVMAGIIFGILIIILSGFTGFTIAIPEVSFSISGSGVFQFLTSTVIAPLTEEPLFLVAIPSFLTVVFLAFFGNKILALGLSLVSSSVIFSAFHYVAYGASISLAIGAFTGAFLFRLIMLTIELVKEKDFSVNAGARTLAITIPAHAVFNTYIYARPLFIAGGGP